MEEAKLILCEDTDSQSTPPNLAIKRTSRAWSIVESDRKRAKDELQTCYADMIQQDKEQNEQDITNSIFSVYKETKALKLRMSKNRVEKAMAELIEIRKSIEKQLEEGLTQQEVDDLNRTAQQVLSHQGNEGWMSTFVSFFSPKPALKIDVFEELRPRLSTHVVAQEDLLRHTRR